MKTMRSMFIFVLNIECVEGKCHFPDLLACDLTYMTKCLYGILMEHYNMIDYIITLE